MTATAANDNEDATAAALNTKDRFDSYLKTYFPFEQIRAPQREVLRQIYNALDSGAKYIVLEAPTGFGKSAVALTMARGMEEAFIISATKDLQEQYHKEFQFIRMIKGRGNFRCFELEEIPQGQREGKAAKGMCDVGPCVGQEYMCKYKPDMDDYDEGSIVDGWKGNKKYREEYEDMATLDGHDNLADIKPCLYFDQKYRGLTAPHTVMNYRYFFTLCTYSPQEVSPRALIVFDEAHAMEDQMVDFTKVTFNKRALTRLMPEYQFPEFVKDPGQMFSLQYWRDHLKNILTGLVKVLSLVTMRGSNKEQREAFEEVVRDDPYAWSALAAKNNRTEPYIEELKETINKLEKLINEKRGIVENPDNWVVKVQNDPHDWKAGAHTVEFVPLDIAPYFWRMFEKGDTVLCMSATILDIDAFCRSVGLPRSEVTFIRVPSDFPKENRPIYAMNTGKLNSESLKSEELQSKIALTVDRVMALHAGQRGIIHTTSYKQLKFIKEQLSPGNRRRLIETGPTLDRMQILQLHEKARDSVLISPSLHTGLDLKGDLSRFQVIVKVTYPDMSDRWIKAKMGKSQRWYSWQTALKLVQAYGRSIRSKDDFAETYLLDSGFVYFVRSNKWMLPGWFTEAIVYQQNFPPEVAACK